MSSCLHLIQRPHQQIPHDAVECVHADDAVVIMNGSELSATLFQNSAVKREHLYQLTHSAHTPLDDTQTPQQITYAQLVELTISHARSISW